MGGRAILLSALLLGCRAPEPREGALREAESLPGAEASRVERWLASGGIGVGGDFGPEGRALRLPAPAKGERLWLRYSRVEDGAASLAVVQDGRPSVRALPSTGHTERFEWIELGPLRAAAETALETQGDGLCLDQIAMLPPDLPPPADRSPRVWREGGLELRVAEEVRLRDPTGILRVIGRHQQALVEWTGLPRPPWLGLALLADERWPDPRTGAFQSGGMAFFPVSALQRPWHLWSHELCHAHQRAAFDAPRFFREGVACLCDLLTEQHLYQRHHSVAAQEALIAQLLRMGNAAHRPGAATASPVFEWSELSAERQAELDGALYEWSYAIVWSLVRRHGLEWLQAVHRQMQEAPAPRAGPAAGEHERCRALVELFSRCAGEDLAPQFERWGLRTEPGIAPTARGEGRPTSGKKLLLPSPQPPESARVSSPVRSRVEVDAQRRAARQPPPSHHDRVHHARR